MELLKALAPYVPVFQTFLWVTLIGLTVILFYREYRSILNALKGRVETGSSLKVGTSGFEVGAAPESIQKGESRVATSEGAQLSTPEALKEVFIHRRYPEGFTDEIFLVHGWEVLKPSSGRKDGNYRIRIWVESYDESLLDKINRVTYRLPGTFLERIITTKARNKNFELWLNCWGEFTIAAYLEREEKPALWLNRHLTLPGRPPG